MIAGAAVAAAAYAGRYGILAWQAFKARPRVPRMRRFYEGGFQSSMTRREAALILGVRCVLSYTCFIFFCFASQIELVLYPSELLL